MALKEELIRLQEIQSRIDESKLRMDALTDQLVATTYGDPNQPKIREERDVVFKELNRLKNDVINQLNIVQCLENFGQITSITDELGFRNKDIPDFRKIKTDNISFDEDNILVEKRPAYIPVIDEEKFKNKGYVFDAIRIEEDTYVLSVLEYNDQGHTPYVLTTLDQLVLILDYYTTKAKAKNDEEAERRSDGQEKYWDSLSEEKRKNFLEQRGLYHSLPAKEKKKITQAEYEALDWEGKEKIYKFYKRYGAKRIVSKLDDNTMWASFHYMYQRFINPEAWPINKDRVLQVGKKASALMGMFGNPEIFEYWYWFRDMMDFKIKDIKIQRTEKDETYATAIETSFGESNTSDVLKEKYGILVKRQNGDKINPIEIEQIRESWDLVQKTFGNLKPNAIKRNLKISHSGKKNMFAMKAIGVYISEMGTIGVSDKYGDNQFKSTMSHECAHFIDNFVGELNGKRWSTDDYEGTAGKIAFAFRNNMNKPKSQQTDYVNATKECFARAFQQYFGVINYGDDAHIHHSYIDLGKVQPIYSADNFLSKEKFESKVKPLIIQFLEENKDVFAYTVDIDNSNDIVPVGTEEIKPPIQEIVDEEQLIRDTIDGLELIFEDSSDEEKKAITDTIEGLKLLL